MARFATFAHLANGMKKNSDAIVLSQSEPPPVELPNRRRGWPEEPPIRQAHRRTRQIVIAFRLQRKPFASRLQGSISVLR
jgi:hypothetical protein